MTNAPEHPLLAPLRAVHWRIRAAVLEAFQKRSLSSLSAVAEDGPGDTIYAVDAVSESVLTAELAPVAAANGGIVLVAEGIAGGQRALPAGIDADGCRYRVLVDPIDGTRGLMYQKRPAWILTGVAPNRGSATRLADIELALQTELPLAKQYLADELWAVRGLGAAAERLDLLSGARRPLSLEPSRATNIEHGFASVCRFFPGARDVLAAIDDAIVGALLPARAAGKAPCFEDQYASTGGQLYELMAGHDRFIADVRPLLASVLARRGQPLGLCCHPYDLCTALIAEEAGVCLRSPWGERLDAPFDVSANVSWVGYANRELLARIEPVLIQALEHHGLRGESEP